MKTKGFVLGLALCSVIPWAAAQPESPPRMDPTDRQELRRVMSEFEKQRNAEMSERKAAFAKKPFAEQKSLMLSRLAEAQKRLTETRTCLEGALTSDALHQCHGPRPGPKH